MTFKHINFSDSEIMRSFEKIAHDKNMIKPEQKITKKSSVLDILPTNNFNENILKLCSFLRHKGFISQAEELENNFLNYKSVELNDPGEKRIEDAHDASPKFGDSEYGVIENILEEHKKIMDIVQKQPTGKLATNNDIIRAVKKILAEDIVEGVDFGDIVFDNPNSKNKSEVVEVTIGEPEIYYVKSDKLPQVDVEIGEPIIDESHNKIANLKKHSQEITSDIRQNSANDTLKKAIIFLKSADTEFRSINGVDIDDVNEFNKLISSVILKIENVNISNDIPVIISAINSLKTTLTNFRDSWWDWLTRPIFSEAEHKALFSSTFNYLNKALLQAKTAQDVLNGVRDNDLKKIIQPKVDKSSGEKELLKFTSQLEDWVSWFKLTKPFENETDNEKAAQYILQQFLTPLNGITEYFNRIKDKDPVKANDFVKQQINKIKNTKEYLTVLNDWHPGVL